MLLINKKDKHVASSQGKILFISWTVPPIMGSHGNRVIHFLKYLKEYAWSIDVLTIRSSTNFPHFDPLSLKLLPNNMHVYRVHPGIFNHIYYNLMLPLKLNSDAPTMETEPRLLANFIEFSKLFIMETNLLWLFDWIPFAVLKGFNLTHKYNYDLIISSGFLGSPIIAYFIKRLKSKLFLIIDYGDPWVFAPTYNEEHTKLKFFLDHWIEERILKVTDILIVTTEETKNSYLKNYPFLRPEKVKVIPMGVDISRFNHSIIEPPIKFRILYAGSIYPTRDIYPFLEAVRQISSNGNLKDKIEILLVGNINNEIKKLIADMNLKEIISIKGFVPYQNSIKLILGAHILLSFGNKGGLQVPGKLFEYIYARRPILWIKGDENDPAMKYLRNINRSVIVENESKEIRFEIMRLYELYEKGLLEKSFDLNEVPSVSWEDRVKLLNDICKELLINLENKYR